MRVRKEKSGKLILSLLPDSQRSPRSADLERNPHRVKVIEVKPEHRSIADIIGKSNRSRSPQQWPGKSPAIDSIPCPGW
ncbi:MAG UNVERIFIED_CONTAM: hypothetical protein LVR29_09860 [Microcystis novacekii LVE1205-3]